MLHLHLIYEKSTGNDATDQSEGKISHVAFKCRQDVAGSHLPRPQTALSVHWGRSCLGREVSDQQTCSAATPWREPVGESLSSAGRGAPYAKDVVRSKAGDSQHQLLRHTNAQFLAVSRNSQEVYGHLLHQSDQPPIKFKRPWCCLAQPGTSWRRLSKTFMPDFYLETSNFDCNCAYIINKNLSSTAINLMCNYVPLLYTEMYMLKLSLTSNQSYSRDLTNTNIL